MPSFSTTLEPVHFTRRWAAGQCPPSRTCPPLEPLLAGADREPDAARVMKACSVDLDEIAQELEEFSSGTDLSTLWWTRVP